MRKSKAIVIMTQVTLGWSLNQLWKSSYKVHNNFLKTETRFMMTS